MNAGDPPPLITECPNCNTRFRVGESQLQMAHGRVRCGACLAVFAGVDHLLLDESSEPPKLPAEPDALDSVLAELDIDSGSSGFESAVEPKTSQDAAPNGSEHSQNISESHDWTSVSVDTREFGDKAGFDTDSVTIDEVPVEPRASIEDALNDEEALRWWLEDELPGESADNHASEPVGQDGSVPADGMVVQLSHFDAVQEEELDLRSLIATSENDTSARELEELFEEDDLETPVTSEQAGVVQAELEELELELEGSEQDVLGEISANELQDAIDEAEPLVSRAMANGTIAAAAERMSASATPAQEEIAPLPEFENAVESEPVALVVSPHRSARAPETAAESVAETEAGASRQPVEPDVPIDIEAAEEIEEVQLKVEAEAEAEAQAEAQAEAEKVQALAQAVTEAESARAEAVADIWDTASFPETPAESVVDIAEEMAAAGQPVVEPEPSVLERTKDLVNGFLGHALALRTATLLAFLALSGQILYWQFADWSKTATMRPVYASICSVIGCELPARRSVRDLQSRKLAVRSHPDKADALLVDALIINEANFEQPFPVIELQFMDISQQLVGSYRLEPSVYLDGELAGSDALMAVRTPVHIDIDIPDPGPKAVNYQLQFR